MKQGSYAIVAIILVITSLIQLHITCTEAFPVRKTRNYDDFNFPESSETVDKRPTNSCYVHVTNQYNEEGTDGGVKSTNITSRRCCDGYTGEECNIISDPYLAASPCSRTTCPNFPDANCAVITRCGEDIPIYLDDEGDIVDCGNNATNVPNITSLSCGGFCEEDPCEGLTCASHPSAVCVSSSCTCQPIWLLETGVSVNCTTGNPIPPDQVTLRRKRQVSVEASSATAVESSCSS